MFDDFEIRGNSTALISEDGKAWSYRELADSSYLSTEKLVSGSICFLVCDSLTLNIVYYLGLLRKRITIFLIPEGLAPEKLAKLISLYTPNYVISKKVIDQPKYHVNDSFGEVYVFENTEVPHIPNLQNIALCLTTSGTTGDPKFVKLTLKNLESNAISIMKALNIDEYQKTITTMPMFYSYGLSVINTSLAAGGTLVLNSSQVTSKEFWQRVIDYKVNTLSGVPYIYEQLSRVTAGFLSRTELRKFTQAGGRLNADVRNHFKKVCAETGIKFYVMYGQTEATARMSVLPPEDFPDYENAVGFAVPEGKMFIIDSSGKQIENPGEEGEICYEGPNVFLGYATHKEELFLNEARIPFLRTGDLGFFDKDGRFFITGRLKRIAKLLGTRVNLEEVEKYLFELGFETVCIEYMDKLRVVSVNADIPEKTRQSVCNYLKVNPRLVSFSRIPILPRLPSGKVDYGAVANSVGAF